MDDRNTTTAGWVLFAGIIALGGWIVSGEMYHGGEVEKGGYALPGGEEGAVAGADVKPVEFYLASADPVKGEAVFKKCAACHVAVAGGANGIGPNLWAVMGKPIGKSAGYAFSAALSGKGGNWDWQAMDDWLASPRAFAPGTKMTFAGLGSPEDRANVIVYLNKAGSNLPIPPAPAEAAPATAPADGNAVVPADGNAAAPADGNVAAPANSAAPKPE